MSHRIPTFADLCSAIAEGHIVTTTDGIMYHVNALELRRYLNKLRPLPVVSTTTLQEPVPHPNSQLCSLSTKTSIA